jgi:hypothetical protein
MFNPCIEHCYARYGKQYSEECDSTCAYAKSAKEKITNKKLNDKYLEEMNTLHDNNDTELAHGTADKILCDMLSELGYVDIVESFNKVDKWYS